MIVLATDKIKHTQESGLSILETVLIESCVCPDFIHISASRQTKTDRRREGASVRVCSRIRMLYYVMLME